MTTTQTSVVPLSVRGEPEEVAFKTMFFPALVNNKVILVNQPGQRITCGIIEKAALHRAIIIRYINRIPELELIWECEFQETAYHYFEQGIPDLLFMNLRHLPVQIDSILRPILMHHEGIIITTGFVPQQVDQIPFPYLDYLVKPFSFEKFQASVKHYKGLRGM